MAIEVVLPRLNSYDFLSIFRFFEIKNGADSLKAAAMLESVNAKNPIS